VFDARQAAENFLREALAAFDAEGGAVYLHQNGQTEVLYQSDKWNGSAQVSIPLQRDGKTLGVIALGKRRNGLDYSSQDRALLEKSGDLIARAVTIAQIVNPAQDGERASAL
jgi:predicted heme/steroid binding protein